MSLADRERLYKQIYAPTENDYARRNRAMEMLVDACLPLMKPDVPNRDWLEKAKYTLGSSVHFTLEKLEEGGISMERIQNAIYLYFT